MNSYIYIKKIAYLFFPKKWLIKNEHFFRTIFSVFFIGSKYKCNVCGRKNRRFINIQNDKKCPFCGSLARDRRLLSIIDKYSSNNELIILDFSPSRCIYKKLMTHFKNYIASDLSGDFSSDVSYDITDIPTDSNFYDLIICYHILEHVENDIQAIQELYRVLKKDAFCIIQTPFKDGEIYEDFSIIDSEMRKVHFGQSDHCRIYSINSLIERLNSVGFSSKIITFNESENNFYGFINFESIIIATKNL